MLPPIPFPTLGFQVVDWIEEYLVHGPGDVQGSPMILDDERALHILWAYALFPKGHPFEGQRMVLRDVLSRPKGWAKSELAGAVACAEALGPVRFDGWDARGEPVGRPVVYPFIRCLATEEEQSGNTYDNVAYMLQHGAAADEFALDVGLTRTFIKELGGGEIVPSTSASASKDGGKESFAVADETHLYVQQALKAMYRTVARNTGKRKDAEPWMLDTTTAFEPGEESIAEAAHDTYSDVEPADALDRFRVLFDHQQAEGPRRWDSDRDLVAALKQAYGKAAAFIDFNRLVALIRSPDSTEAEGRRYFLNQPVKGERTWIAKEQWAELADTDCQVEPNARPAKVPIALGFDGSRFHDATGLIGCTEDGHLFVLGKWEKPAGPAGVGWEVPEDEVNAAVDEAFELYDVVRFYPDPPFWQAEVNAWEAKHGAAVAPWWTNRDTPMARAVGAMTTEIRTAAITHDGDEMLARHVANAHKRKVRVRLEDEAEEAYVLTKERRGSPKKIDLAAAAVLAREACRDAIADGEFAARRRRRSKRLRFA